MRTFNDMWSSVMLGLPNEQRRAKKALALYHASRGLEAKMDRLHEKALAEDAKR